MDTVQQTSPLAKVLAVFAFVALGLGAFLALGMYLANTPDGKERVAERGMIDNCRADQNDELQDLATRRLVRQRCDQMVAQYRIKWGSDP